MKTRKQLSSISLAALIALAGVGFSGTNAHAFCGFYVAGGESSLFNDATQVVMMRYGQRTVLSMQNNYQGPPENFAMVIPVPVVLQQDNVNTLSAEIFAKVDNLSAPRLVEYWEIDPCMVPAYDEEMMDGAVDPATDDASDAGGSGGGVVVEAEFTVGEYDIVILSTDDATALETWLTNNEYTIPEGASTHFDPYVQGGSYFFVAKVNIEEVTMTESGNVVLSPLRFYYDSESFNLPIKLGLINSQGSQDLIVYTLGADTRYELANRPNVTIPTNIEVVNEVRDDFGTFYRALFAETMEQNPGAAVTEYSWDASSCDPCPGPTLDQSDFMTFGADVLDSEEAMWMGWTLTRLHLRYDSTTLGDDLVFQAAEPIMGGREVWNGQALETGAVPGWTNNFQGRYIIRHRWEGEVACENPVYGRWGGPNGSEWPGSPQSAPSPNTEGDSAADAGGDGGGLPSEDLEDLVYDSIPELGVDPSAERPDSTVGTGSGDTTETGGGETDTGGDAGTDTKGDESGCTCESTDGTMLGLLLAAWLLVMWRRRRDGLEHSV